MKKKIFALSVTMMCVCTVSFLSVSTVNATSNHMEMTSAGDGHCTKCGLLHNGHYRCPAFYPASKSQSTTCACGHSKSSHAYRR